MIQRWKKAKQSDKITTLENLKLHAHLQITADHYVKVVQS